MPDEYMEPRSMAAVGSLFQTVVTYYTFAETGWVKIISANPRRSWIRFDFGAQPNTGMMVMPEGVQGLPVSVVSNVSGYSLKWFDAPSVVAGAWYASSNIGSDMYVTECVNIGG